MSYSIKDKSRDNGENGNFSDSLCPWRSFEETVWHAVLYVPNDHCTKGFTNSGLVLDQMGTSLKKSDLITTDVVSKYAKINSASNIIHDAMYEVKCYFKG